MNRSPIRCARCRGTGKQCARCVEVTRRVNELNMIKRIIARWTEKYERRTQSLMEYQHGKEVQRG